MCEDGRNVSEELSIKMQDVSECVCNVCEDFLDKTRCFCLNTYKNTVYHRVGRGRAVQLMNLETLD